MAERLTPKFRPQGGYQRSLDVLRIVKEIAPGMIVKSGLMVGLGETTDEVRRTFHDLRTAGCDILTVGQYLQPSVDRHTPVAKFYTPEEFDTLAEYARGLGFLSVASGPFVRSSYNASEVFEESRRRQRKVAT
jgi:lipoic acid synthetase